VTCDLRAVEPTCRHSANRMKLERLVIGPFTDE
jgi:hypothetical protein